WLSSVDGGVFSFGAASFHGSLGAAGYPEPVVGIAAHGDGGYWLVLTGHLAPARSPRPPPAYLHEGDTALGEGSAAPDGTYRQVSAGELCSFEVRDADGGMVTWHVGTGRHVVRLRPTEGTFRSSPECGTWTTDLFPATPTLTSAVGDGDWLVGIDV